MYAGSFIVGAVATAAWWFDLLWPLIYLVIGLSAAYYTVQWNLVRGKLYEPPPPTAQVNIASVLLQKMMDKEAAGNTQQLVSRKTIISRSLDNALQEVIDLICHDFILNWYQKISGDQTPLINSVQSEMWQLVDNINSRLSAVDVVTVATQDVVEILHEHFRAIRLGQKRDGDQSEGPQRPFLLHPWLKDEEREEECLRQITEALLLILLPPAYSRCDSHRHLLREIISTSVLQVTIDMLCDPDYINQKILAYIKQQEKLMADTKRTYTYAASYEDFVKMINACVSMEDLKQMRYKIISEIMQATTINNLKKAQGIDTDKESSPKSTAKGELLKARNLKRYINQLTVAKQLVEKRMQSSGGGTIGGGSSGGMPASDIPAGVAVSLPGQKVLSFAVIMETPKAREYFMRFLEEDGKDCMVGFCIDVESLRTCSQAQQHQVATEVYQQYVTKSNLPVDKSCIKGMENFLRGDGGPEAFYEAEKQVREVLEKQYYHSFFVSDLYHQYISTEEAEDDDVDDHEQEDLDNLSIVSTELFLDKEEDVQEEEEDLLADQSYHARQLLRQLDAKITNKTQAMQALLSSQKLEKEKVKKLHEDLEKEVDKMRKEQKELEVHIERTKLWTENVGHWRASVVSATVEVEEERKVPHFVVLVSLDSSKTPTSPIKESLKSPVKDPPNITIPNTKGSVAIKESDVSQGWAVQRTLDDFYTLHEKMSQMGQWLQKKDLPSQSRGPFRSMDAAYLERARVTLNDYLLAVMQDEKMIHNETLYTFFSPSPKFLHHPTTQQRNKFSLLKRGLPNLKQDAQDDDDFLFFFNDDSSKDDRQHDSIAKPLYGLLGEVFELRGMFKWLRRSFMTFVELTFGSNINRQLREMVKWTYSEQMLLFYIRTFKDSMWPGGKLSESPPPKTDAQKFETRMAAKNKLLQNIPDTLKNLVGEDNARRGTIKVFEVLQNKALNKHLIYNLLEIFLLELCPELKKTRQSYMESLQQMPPQTAS